MNEEFRLHDSDVETLDLLLDAWEDAIDNGHQPDPEVICRDAPHLLEEFKARIEKLSKMDQRLQPAPAPEAESADGTVIQRSAPEAVPSHAIEWQTDVSQLEYHAHGGLGIVFRGFDRQLHRVVAVKFIRERRRHIPIDAQRFRVEAEITSRLDHPGVAPVHGYGLTESGVPFYAMRLVEGKTLQQRIDSFHNRLRKEATPSDSSLEFRKLLNSFISVCNTIEYAHTRGVVNCDIKPGNVMLGKYGETVVLDWGCAKYVGSAGKAKSVGEESLKPQSDTANSNSGATGGTPIYMSPEQHLNSEEVGPSSDIYSLGATLYRIITGQPAFSPENSLAKIRETVIRGRFRKPTDICPWLSKSLEAVCLKAMALAPEDRYRSAEELARDLERYLADEEVEAYVEPFTRRIARLMRRHRGVSRVLFGSLAVLILFSMVFAGVMGQSATREAAARTKATDMRNRSLQVAARSAATSMALKINDAWRILEIEANSEQLRQQMLEKGTVDFEMGDWTEIQSWLVRRAEAQEVATHASSWFLCRADGTQVARYPLVDENGEMFGSIGENYSHRDYFHGNGQDLPEGAVGSPAHINQIHLSVAYRSSNTKDLKVAFSIPIWSDPAGTVDRKFLGVLGYSVELGTFAVLQDENESAELDEISALVDLRNGGSEGSTHYGMFLQHPAMKELLTQPDPELNDVPRLGGEVLREIEAYRVNRIAEISRAGYAASTTNVLLIQNYADPLNLLENRTYVAACEPVCVAGRSSQESFNTGWLVIVQGPSE